MKIAIGGKCSDMGWMQVTDEEGVRIIDYDGYVPEIAAIGGGDYIEIEIDNDTGKVIGWVPLTVSALQESIGELEDEDDNFDNEDGDYDDTN